MSRRSYSNKYFGYMGMRQAGADESDQPTAHHECAPDSRPRNSMGAGFVMNNLQRRRQDDWICT